MTSEPMPWNCTALELYTSQVGTVQILEPKPWNCTSSWDCTSNPWDCTPWNALELYKSLEFGFSQN